MRILGIFILFLSFSLFGQKIDAVKTYQTGDTSVVYFSWENNRRIIQLFDQEGNKTYQLEGIRMSYTVTNKLEFRKNGGVKRVVQSSNPGASMYTYKTYIEFDTTNIPLKKWTKKFPEELADLENQTVWLWSTKLQKWVKQK